MNKNNPRTTSVRSPIAAVVYSIISILLLPVTLIGYIFVIGKLFLAGRGSGISTTAQGPLSARSTQHLLGVRKDEAANRLMKLMPSFSPLGWSLASMPMILAHRLTGYVPRAFQYPFEGEVAEQYEASARQTFFDNVVHRYLSDITQFVILGAGFDTRAYQLPKNKKIRSFEVDTSSTQSTKRQLLQKAGIDSTAVTFVSANFEQENWLTKLIDAGFDSSKPALFVLEGVIIYLNRESVEDTFRKIASTAKGSIVAFDYFTSESIESQAFYWRFARWSTKAAGEPIKFGIDSTPPLRERTAEILQSCGLSLLEQRTLGDETEGKRAWAGFAVAIVK